MRGGFFGAQRCTSFVPQVSCLNSQSCRNNQPNLFSEGPLYRVQLHHVTVTLHIGTLTMLISGGWGSFWYPFETFLVTLEEPPKLHGLIQLGLSVMDVSIANDDGECNVHTPSECMLYPGIF